MEVPEVVDISDMTFCDGMEDEMMRLTKNNIACVKQYKCGDITYGWFVVMRDNCASSSRMYINYENGRTVAKEYDIDRLPKAVIKYISQSVSTEIYSDEEGIYKQYKWERENV